MDLCQNDSETAESIKEAKAICTHTIQEAETICSAAIMDAETQGASKAESLHRQHAEVIKCLEKQVIQEEGKSQIDFLSTCQAALNASPGELRGTVVASYHILLGQAPTCHPFSLSQGASPAKQPSASAAPPVLAPEYSPRPKRWLPSPDPVDGMPLGRTTSKATTEGPLALTARGPTLVQGTQAEPLRSIQMGH